MEIKRLILAIALSTLVFTGWQWLSVEMGWIKPAPQNYTAQQTQNNSTDVLAEAKKVDRKIAEKRVNAPSKIVVVETPLYRAEFEANGATLKNFSLSQYKRYLGADSFVLLVDEAASEQQPMALWLEGLNTADNGEWFFDGENLLLSGDEVGSLTFRGKMNGLDIERKFTFSAKNYLIQEDVQVLSDSSSARNLRPAFTLATSRLSSEKRPSVFERIKYWFFGGEKPENQESSLDLTRVAWLRGSSYDYESSVSTLGQGKRVAGDVAWVGVANNFYLCAVSLTQSLDNTLFGKFSDGVYQISLGKPDEISSPGSTYSLRADYYLGPKTTDMLEQAPNGLSRALYYGWFSLIASPLVMLLQFLNRFVHNYGIAIILMTCIVKLLFWGLSKKSYQAMENMKRLQPEMLALRERFKDDKEGLNRATIELYRTHKVNPASGCLPVLVQIPVFIGLYQALLNSVELRHSAFITYLPFTQIAWLNDLSAPDPFYLTPILVGVTMFLQQRMSPPPGDPIQAKVMLYMPFLFMLFFLESPSGLVLYFLVNSIISIIQQFALRRSLANS